MADRANPTIDRGIDAATEAERIFSDESMPGSVNGSVADLNQDGFADRSQLAIDLTNGGRLVIQTKLVKDGAATFVDLSAFSEAARARLAA